MGSDRISPTAHYTGEVWFRSGRSHPALSTRAGRRLYALARPANAAAARLGLPTLEGLLVARHEAIDRALSTAIDAGLVSQVIEVAAGLSPRGWAMKRRYGDRVIYVEADLPGMATRKRALLRSRGLLTPGHRVEPLDALSDDGPHTLARLAAALEPQRGLAIVTEGLLNYFPTEAVTAMWARFARCLSGFSQGLYLSDLHLASDNRGAAVALFVRTLSVFVRGTVHLHFRSAAEAESALRAAGFASLSLCHPPPQQAPGLRRVDMRGAQMVRIVEARTAQDSGSANTRAK